MDKIAKVGIVIVCMNNLKNLIPCIESIHKYTKVTCDIWVNCYLFSEENLKTIRDKYSDINIIVNNQIAGFSENNNLILKDIQNEYTLIINDDTEIHEGMIDILVDDLEKNPQISVISPVLYYEPERVQYCGRNPIRTIDFILEDMCIAHLCSRKSKWINQQGLFQTYNVTGACFIVRTDLFRRLGFFDEIYFFCPEDVAFSTLVNKSGYQCWVDTRAAITHHCGITRSGIMKTATLPAQRKGCVIFWGKKNVVLTYILQFLIAFSSLGKVIMWTICKNKIERRAQWNCVKSIFVNKTPKAIFMKFYKELKTLENL